MATKYLPALIFPVLLFCGCAVQGWLITRTVTPYTRDFRETPVGTKTCIISHHKLKEPVSGYDIYAEWTSGTLTNSAANAGITNICYMDLRTFSILAGIYRKRDLIIYGD